MQVTFRKVEDVEIAEVELLNGTVAAFLATDKEPESGQCWCDRFGSQYARFKKDSEPKKEPELVPEPEVEPEPVNQGANILPEQQHAQTTAAYIPPPADA